MPRIPVTRRAKPRARSGVQAPLDRGREEIAGRDDVACSASRMDLSITAKNREKPGAPLSERMLRGARRISSGKSTCSREAVCSRVRSPKTASRR